MENVNLKTYVFDQEIDEKKFVQYRKLWNRSADYEVLTDFPMHLDIELSGLCNLKCQHCFQNSYINSKLGFMSFELFKKIIDEGTREGLCAIKLQVRGESFLNPKWSKCCQYAKNAGIMDVQVTTNATLLTRDLAREIFKSDLDGIIFSVDSHHGLSWEKRIKKDENYDFKIENNIREFLETREQLRRKTPWVRIQSSIQSEDIKKYRQIREDLRARFPRVDAVIVNKIHNFKNNEDSYPGFHSKYHLQPCKHLFQRLAVFWNGKVTTCCMDYNNTFQLGQFPIQSIKNIWTGNPLQNIRKIHLSGGRTNNAICKHCHIHIRGGHKELKQKAHPLG